jgi:annexin A7/11
MNLLKSVLGKNNFSNQQAEDVAKSFKAAMKGVGCDEKRIIKEIIGLNNDQRQVVKERYQAMYGHTLEEDLKSELRGDFENIVVALLKPRLQFEAECIRGAFKGIGTRDKCIVELLCTKEASEIEKLKEVYKTCFGSNLEDDIKDEEHGDTERVYRSIATGDRPSGSAVDNALAEKEAQDLYNAGEGKSGTDDSEFVRILVSRSFAQLRATFDAYQKIAGKDIEKSIINEMNGDLEEALVAIVQSIRNRQNFFAQRLNDSMKGTGTDENQIIRIIVSRSEIDLVNIRREYQELYKRSLCDDLAKELKGDFEEIILELVGKD